MKKYILIYALALCALVGCKDNSGLYGLLTDYDYRIAELEQICNKLNTNIEALQVIVEAQQTGDYITGITPIMESGVEIGYTITFAKHTPITIYHGKNGADGKDGQDGQNGTNGTNGTNGADGHTPIIGVAQDTDGIYYWTLDGTWLLDGNSNKIRVTGQDGKDGQDGQNGQNGTNGTDGITPQLKIEADYWWISYDNGVTWTQLGKAKGDDGADGQDGQDGDSMFQSVTQDENLVYFTLVDGTVITISKNADSNNGGVTTKENGHPYVDLGLPSGTMWSTCNLGGYTPGDFGDYYDFGATEPLTKTNANKAFVVGGTTIGNNGSIAGSQYDAARENWGGRWQVPTKEMWSELNNNCTKRHITAVNEYDINIDGVLFVSNNNGKSIYLPLNIIPNKGMGNTAITYNYYGYYHTSQIATKTSSDFTYYYYILNYSEYYNYYYPGVQETITMTENTRSSTIDTYDIMVRPVFIP